MDVFATLIVLQSLTISRTLCAGTNGENAPDTNRQGTSFLLMKEIFKLDGILQEIKTTQLKEMKDDIEKLTTIVYQNGDQSSSGPAVEELRKEIDTLKKENKEMKEEDLTLSREKKLIKDMHLETVISNLQRKDIAMESVITRSQSSKSGVTYVRWGRRTCPGYSEKVYSGYAGGGHYSHSGTGANYLCLTDAPEYGYYDEANPNTGAYVYGGEYEMGYGSKYDASGYYGQRLTTKDAVCVVCRPPRPSVIMIPAKRTCDEGWTFEYRGYLVGGLVSHTAASEFICLDGRPEARIGSQLDENGKLFYLATGHCGSLPCPPYVQGRQLTCVVCSK